MTIIQQSSLYSFRLSLDYWKLGDNAKLNDKYSRYICWLTYTNAVLCLLGQTSDFVLLNVTFTYRLLMHADCDLLKVSLGEIFIYRLVTVRSILIIAYCLHWNALLCCCRQMYVTYNGLTAACVFLMHFYVILEFVVLLLKTVLWLKIYTTLAFYVLLIGS